MKNNISRFIKAGAGWWGMSLLWMKKWQEEVSYRLFSLMTTVKKDYCRGHRITSSIIYVK
jgi:hypothetical protein